MIYIDTAFGNRKQLWPYQGQALEKAVRFLLQYYSDPEADADERKRRLCRWYQSQGMDATEFDERFAANERSRNRRQIRELLMQYGLLEQDTLPFWRICNRAGFWMATGSGKTLVIVKLIEQLAELMGTGKIPERDILVLSHKDDLLQQIRWHVDEYNASLPKRRVLLEDLRRLPDLKRQGSLFRDQEITAFIYNSDNLTTRQKEKEIDFRNYENGGRWYIILDEAHRGNNSDSLRKAIFHIMSRNGFLFNFSATFTDPKDIATTIFNFNLSEFINAGYGKHIVLLGRDTSAFSKRMAGPTDTLKGIVVLQALLLLTYIKRSKREIPAPLQYHSPMMVVFVNSVNTEDSDLQVFFQELERVGRGEVDGLEEAREELIGHLQRATREFVREKPAFNMAEIRALTLRDILQEVYNADAPGTTEVIVSPNDDKELAFKLKSGDRPYALIRIGNIREWLKKKLKHVEVVESLQDSGFFYQLDGEDSPINILMGSRVFYEGWDSNRPNIALYINIGRGSEAKKFVLQSLGRGVRISPIPGTRGRLGKLIEDGHEIALSAQEALRSVEPVETLFVFSSKVEVMDEIVQVMDTISTRKDWVPLDVQRNAHAVGQRLLLIPTYRPSQKPLLEERDIRKLEIHPFDLNMVKAYVSYVDDDRILWAAHGYSQQDSQVLRQILSHPSEYFAYTKEGPTRNVHEVLATLRRYFGIYGYELGEPKGLDGEIMHYQHISVRVDHLDRFQTQLQRVKSFHHLHEALRIKDVVSAEELREVVGKAVPETTVEEAWILYLSHHYYYPILAARQKLDYLKYIITTDSEFRFIQDLKDFLDTRTFDCEWWMFSKVDEHLDKVYIPYYDRRSGEIRKYFPDFIFWFQKGREYTVVFVDPKGSTHTDYEYKVDGYKYLFEDNGVPRIFTYKNLAVRFLLKLYTKDSSVISHAYRRYWIDSVDKLLSP
ncbi:MAG: DEAD/DEAH box helicase family protein [Thermus sp.]|nr:DEAD/DEAH box helicase family protein [Thermus sp.]